MLIPLLKCWPAVVGPLAFGAAPAASGAACPPILNNTFPALQGGVGDLALLMNEPRVAEWNVTFENFESIHNPSASAELCGYNERR